jgi:hypothetical protein
VSAADHRADPSVKITTREIAICDTSTTEEEAARMVKDVAKVVSIVIIRCQHPPQAQTRVLTCGTGHIAVTKPVIENTGYLMKTPPPRSVFTAETASGDVSCGATMAAIAKPPPPSSTPPQSQQRPHVHITYTGTDHRDDFRLPVITPNSAIPDLHILHIYIHLPTQLWKDKGGDSYPPQLSV